MNEKNIKSKIEDMIATDDIVLFMKGSPDFPQCGFSANVVGILNYFKVNYKSYNVLEDNDLREGIKVFSNWPTVPQIYIKKEFIGGCDILKEIAENGEIEEVFKDKNINYSIPTN
tara:strand:- start:1296 stop:1640 length:345 start_codon:yes stop_codon:yes gene_type:complete